MKGDAPEFVEVVVTKHATESEEKVLRAALSVFHPDVRHKVSWEVQRLQGHYGNPIHVYRAAVSGEEAAKTFEHILKSLDKSSLRFLISTLESRLDGRGNLHVRLHKQLLLEGRMTAWDGDDIVKVVIKVGKSAKEAEKLLESYLSEP